MKLILISDTHGYEMPLPEGDILIHAGDLTGNGLVYQVQHVLDWLNGQPHKHVVITPGNHDFAFESPEKKATLNFGRVIYLENNAVEVEGLKIYGSPVTPRFMDWAFNVDRGEAIRKYWDMIPNNVDILVTHGPPMGILDQAAPHFNSPHLGCEELATAVDRTKPRLHMFGHIHGGRGYKKFNGTEFFNATMVNEGYRPMYDAWAVDFETKDEAAAPIAVSEQIINVERTD
jgi:Icc-related predicted phosphoesterase